MTFHRFRSMRLCAVVLFTILAGSRVRLRTGRRDVDDCGHGHRLLRRGRPRADIVAKNNATGNVFTAVSGADGGFGSPRCRRARTPSRSR